MSELLPLALWAPTKKDVFTAANCMEAKYF